MRKFPGASPRLASMHWFRRHPRGRPPHPDILTPAEWRVLEHVREGSPNAEIALRLGVSVNTVKSHVSSMLAKLELRDRRELAAWQGKPVASISQRSRSVWLFVAARLVGVTVLVGGLIVAFAVASAVLAGGGGGGFSPEPITTPTEPTPTPLVPSATATATSVAPPTETELFVLQANGLSGCEHPFYIRGWGLPASTTVRV